MEPLTFDECRQVMTEVWGRSEQYMRQHYAADMKGADAGISFEQWVQHTVDCWTGVGTTILMMRSNWSGELCIEPQGDKRLVYFRRPVGDAMRGGYVAIEPKASTGDLAADIQRAAIRAHAWAVTP